MAKIIFCLLSVLSLTMEDAPTVSQAASKKETGEGEAETISYISPTAYGAHLADNFDDPWMFERNWVISKAGTSANGKYKDQWTLLPVPRADWKADLGLSLAPGSRHLVASRLLGAPLQLGSRPLVLQYQLRLPWLRQCAGVQLRLLTDSYDLRPDQVTHLTPSSLLFGTERCNDQLKLQLGVRYVDRETGEVVERRSPPVSGGPLAALTSWDQEVHQYRLVLTADHTAQLFLDDQLVSDIGLQSLAAGTNQAGSGEPGSRGNPAHTEGDTKIKLEPVGGVGVELWSAADGLYLNNLLLTNSLEQARYFAPPPKSRVEATDSQGPSQLDWFLNYSSERPWLYAVFVLAFGVPVCLMISCCCLPESLDLEALRRKAEAQRKKTDEQQTDDKPGGTTGGRTKGVGLFKWGVRSDRARLLLSGEPRRRKILSPHGAVRTERRD